MTKARDIAKLSSVETNATGDQTKADIDALNIDADTLDGSEATAFASAAQGTLADSALQTVAFGDLTTTPTTVSGYGITDAYSGSFADLTSKPTTLSGYGITDALTTTAINTALAGKVDDSQVLTDVPSGAVFTDTTYVSSDFTHDDLTGFVADEHIDWTADQGATNIHSGNYVNTTYVSSDFAHDDLTGFVANEHIDWTTDQGATNIHSGNYTNTTYSVGDGGLTQKNFTTTLKTKLDGISTGATNTAAPAISTNGSAPSLASGITAAEVRSLIGAGTSSSDNATHTGEVTGSGALTVADNVIDAGKLKVTGNGTTSQFLRSDGDGTFTWATPTDTNTVYTHPSHPGDDMSVDTGALTGATVISNLDFNVTTDTLGHVTDANATVATRNLTLGNLGYTGATNANYITNNNQLTNGAGYLNSSSSLSSSNLSGALPAVDGSALTGIAGVPAGVVVYHAANIAPTGFLKANGASLSTTTYADLFAVIGYTFGGSGGSFSVPDLRGEFLRAWDDSRGIDSGRSFGSSQSEDFGSHDHNMFYNAMSGYTGSWTNPGPTDAVFVHTYGASDFAYRMMSAGNSSSYVPTRGATSDTGGTETRPRNVALLACIKY